MGGYQLAFFTNQSKSTPKGNALTNYINIKKQEHNIEKYLKNRKKRKWVNLNQKETNLIRKVSENPLNKSNLQYGIFFNPTGVFLPEDHDLAEKLYTHFSNLIMPSINKGLETIFIDNESNRIIIEENLSELSEKVNLVQLNWTKEYNILKKRTQIPEHIMTKMCDQGQLPKQFMYIGTQELSIAAESFMRNVSVLKNTRFVECHNGYGINQYLIKGNGSFFFGELDN